MTGILRCLRNWFWVLVLLGVTLWFPSTREVQTLCWRWLLHLNGRTTLQGLPDRYGFNFIPHVQFTPEYEQELQLHAHNSLDDYVLAIGTDYHFAAQPPQTESAWRDSPFLPWMTFFLAVRSAYTNDTTNAFTPASMNSVRQLIQLAKSTAPKNGAYSQAEAYFDFSRNDNEAAIQALWTSCTNRHWHAHSAATFSGFAGLFERAGLSKLDAIIQTMRCDPAYIPVQYKCRQILDDLMTQSINSGKTADFLRLFQLLVELRRADWADKDSEIENAYRHFIPSVQLIQTMAVPLKVNLATNWMNGPYEQQQLTRRKIWHDYLSRYADPVALAVFNSQSDSYETETSLRFQVDESRKRLGNLSALGTQVAGICSLLLLSLLCFAFMFETIRWQVKKTGTQKVGWLREPKFWVFTLAAIVIGAEVLVRFVHQCSLTNMDEFENFQRVIWAAIFLPVVGWLVFLVKNALRRDVPINPWGATRFLAVAYLIVVVAMAFCRWRLTELVASRFGG